MASYLISDAPYAAWLSDVLATLEEHKVTKIAVAAPLPTGEVFTGYFSMSTMDKALAATNIQADATLDAICANGQRIQQAWEDNAEDERGVIPMESIISAILAGAVTLIGVLIANSRSQAVTDTKLEELTREVREHNNFARRVPILEEQMKVVNHRLADLEADEHERERN